MKTTPDSKTPNSEKEKTDFDKFIKDGTYTVEVLIAVMEKVSNKSTRRVLFLYAGVAIFLIGAVAAIFFDNDMAIIFCAVAMGGAWLQLDWERTFSKVSMGAINEGIKATMQGLKTAKALQDSHQAMARELEHSQLRARELAAQLADERSRRQDRP